MGKHPCTQNIYLLNGMDMTDPYWTGMPLFFPDFNTLHCTQLINAGHPSSALSPGAYFNLLTQEGEASTLIRREGPFFSKMVPSLKRSHTDELTIVGTTSPGNTEWENDDGVIGSLYDNPNTPKNTKGRMRFDRTYTGRIGINFLALFGIRIGCIVKYYDGQPFARKIIVSGMNQGPFISKHIPVVYQDMNTTGRWTSGWKKR